MTSVKALYANSGVSSGHREFFFKKLSEVQKNVGGTPIEKAYLSLQYVWRCYDTGGISVGRSLRALLIERALKLLKRNDVGPASIIVAHLVAMYHNHAYIEECGWYDYRLDFGLYGSSIQERVHLVAAAYALKVAGSIPDITNLTKDDFLRLVRD